MHNHRRASTPHLSATIIPSSLPAHHTMQLTVERPQQYGFDRHALLDALLGLALRLAAAPQFLAALAAEPDLDGDVLCTALKASACVFVCPCVLTYLGVTPMLRILC